MTASEFHVSVGDKHSFAKTVSESDVYLFAGLTGDFSPNHVNEQEMSATALGGRIAHGALLVGFMSTCSTMACKSSRASDVEVPVALGYDRVRFLKPVRIGDTVTVDYTIDQIDTASRRSVANITVTNQKSELVAVAQHVLKWVPR